MEASEYELIIYIGIAEYSQDLKGYIEMEQLKALDKHINKKMFYTRLCLSIETIVNKYNNRLQRDLANHARHMEMDRQAPEGQKFGFPTELPTIYNFAFPLFTLTGGKYTGEVYFNDIEAFAKAIEANSIELPPQKSECETDQETENNFTLSTIEDWLFQFKESMNESDYKNLVSALIQYFDKGKFPTLTKPIQIKGRPNKKLFGWALNRVFAAKGKGIEKELLLFAKQNISLFKDVLFDENDIFKSRLYKYFTTKTK